MFTKKGAEQYIKEKIKVKIIRKRGKLFVYP